MFPHSCSIPTIFFNVICFLFSRIRSAPAEEQTAMLDVYGSEVLLWHTEQRAEDWHALLAGLLNLCTLIKLSTLLVRPSPPSAEHHPAQWSVSYVWLCFWSELSKNFPTETPMLFHHIKEPVSPAHPLTTAFYKCNCRMWIQNKKTTNSLIATNQFSFLKMLKYSSGTFAFNCSVYSASQFIHAI